MSVRISVTLLSGGSVVGTDTYEILSATRTEQGIVFCLDRGKLVLEGGITKDLEECAQAINQGQYVDIDAPVPGEKQ
jgi:hypothetical protein